ncbi:MAG: homocysteine S-methyltransferase family protein, partial [Bacteroidales bacterium]|nr:homocysteine S-methyltransferase family protein [Bacteroidales bacterium]
MAKDSVFSQDILRQERALRLDGAMGTQIQGFNLTEADFRQGLPVVPTRDVKGNNECLNLTRPDVIRSIHLSYVEAGADIIETNSFGANIMAQQDYGLSSIAGGMAFAAARLAREAADSAPRKVWVAGSMGPGSKSLSLVADFTRPEWRPCSFDEVAAAYEGQARALIEGGVDLIIIETCFDALNAKAALYGVQKARPGFPVIVSVSVSGS